MRILKQTNVEGWTNMVTCHRCKSVLEVTARDLRKVFDSRDGNFAMCSCPVCQHQLTWAQSLIPAAVWEQLRERA